MSAWSASVSLDEPSGKDDPFKGKDPFANTNGETSDPFQDEDPFKNAGPADDPFKGSEYSFTVFMCHCISHCRPCLPVTPARLRICLMVCKDLCQP